MKFPNTQIWNDLSPAEKKSVLLRPRLATNQTTKRLVRKILAQVKSEGDAAVSELTLRFDGVALDRLAVSPAILQAARQALSAETLAAAEAAIKNIRIFHQAQKRNRLTVETNPGIICEKRFVPIQKIGIYIPAGTAPLLSTLLMLAVPAQVAGCSEISLFSPPQKETGEIDATILGLAAYLNITKVYRGGGAQAIAALAYGTESVSQVDKIFGPGNSYVTEAKQQVAADPQGAQIDLPAGPSELLVIADQNADAAIVAADLLSQAEHGHDSQVILLATTADTFTKVSAEIAKQLSTLPRRKLAGESLRGSRFILCASLKEALQVSNLYAPEHLSLNFANAREWADKVENAGSVFLGPWSPESAGDYATGTNHVLPTNGFARNSSGLSLDSFQKSITVQELSPSGLLGIASCVETLAQAEGLMAHSRAISLRRLKLSRASDGVIS